ncbi:MAG: peptidoglycan-binding protein [Alphaproteobacteria bacterium]
MSRRRRLTFLLCLGLLALVSAFAGARTHAADAPAPQDFVAGHAAFVRGDYETAMTLWRGLAERGHVDAAFNVGTLYENGYGVTADAEAATKWYGQAAARRYAPAQIALSRLAEAGDAAAKSKASEDAIRALKDAAERGSAEAQFSLGVAYDRGVGVIQNYATAASWYQRAAVQGLAEAQYNLATLHDQGLGTQNDTALALLWYRTAAEAGSPLAANNLGYLHEYGLGVRQDDGAALAWYRKAAEAGLATAQNNLAIMHQLGRGTPRDFPAAARWYRAAAEQGFAEAQLNLGVLYANGLGVEKDAMEALVWLLRARGAEDEATARRAVELFDSLAAKLDAGQVMTATGRAMAFAPRPSPATLSLAGEGKPQPRGLGGFGDAVLDAQRYLSLLGFYDGVVDGQSGPRTRGAVLDFRRRSDPKADDATIDGALLDALAAAWAARGTTPAAATP